jgi:hypothetical protein
VELRYLGSTYRFKQHAPLQSGTEGGRDFALDLPKLGMVFFVRQMLCAKLVSNILLQLPPQDPEIWVSPYRSFPEFQFVGFLKGIAPIKNLLQNSYLSGDGR